MNLDSRVLVDTSDIQLDQGDTTEFKMIRFEDEKDDFTGISVRNIDVVELNQKEEEEEEN